MQFTVRSLGGKLIIVATFTLLFCMLLFAVLSWTVLGLYAEHQAKSDAQSHLSLITQADQIYTTSLSQTLDKITHTSDFASALSQSNMPALNSLLTQNAATYHLAALNIVSTNHHLFAQSGSSTSTRASLSPPLSQLIDTALTGKTVSSLQPFTPVALNQLSPDAQWTLTLALPIHNSSGAVVAALLASQPIDSYFAQRISQASGVDLALCLSGRMVVATSATFDRLYAHKDISDQKICRPGSPIKINASQVYFMLSTRAHPTQQISPSPDLVIATIEPLALNQHDSRSLLIMAGLGLSVFAFGILLFTFMTSVLLIRPLRRLQVHAQTLVASNTGLQMELPRSNELNMLANSYNLLADSLANESQVLTEQMSNLLVMSDVLISTLNLEHLLGEFVLRMGRIMKAKHASLLLYGREMLSPWAVAQWSDPDSIPSSHASNLHSSVPHGAVTVHSDPDGNITLAATTKMMAIPSSRLSSGSGKRSSTNPSRNPQAFASASYSLRSTRIPRFALRDLDMILARMAIQRQKIVYGEDIAAIYQERQESWARSALEAGYRSAIAVPLLLQDQAIGAFILYTHDPHLISSRDTFLLSTAAIQASMAIQNALLFAEVKEKNAALERANHLKSQFLANVTHELRTPLHSIISYGALILEGFVEGELTTEQEEHIQFMVRRAEDLSHLVDDMLDLSKIEADRIEVKPEPLELASCLTEVVNQLKPMANNKNLYLSLEVEKGLPLAMADSHRIRQVAINLVSNALKFTEKGGVTIRCLQMRNSDMLHVSVSDTGIGISPATFGFIFEAFRQADGSTTRRFGGTGLGLTIAKKLIELQAGEIAVESIPGEGSTFSFTLPAAI